MHLTRRALLNAGLGLPLAAAGLPPARAQAARYPNRPIRLIVPFAAGSSTDIAARSWGELMGRQIPGASFVVENRTGAGGNIGATAAAHSPADGYTVLYSTATTYAIAPFIYSDLQYQPVRDFVPVAVTTSVPTFLVCSAGSDIRSFADLAAKVKAAPDRYNYGSNGVGTHSHITGKLICNRMGVPDLLHVPFKNGSQGVMTEVIAGRIHFAVDAWSVVGPLVRAGKLRALATIGRSRLSVAPDVPTLAELLRKDFDTLTWSGMWVPTGTSQDIVVQLHDAVSSVRRNTPDLAKQYEDQGTPLMPDMSLPQVNAFMKQEIERWRLLAKEANITI